MVREARYRLHLRIELTVTLLPDSQEKDIQIQNTGICPHRRLHGGDSTFRQDNAETRPSTWPDTPILQLKIKTKKMIAQI